MAQPAYNRIMDIFMYATLTISGVAIGATILLAFYYLRAWCMSRYETGMSSQHDNNDGIRGTIDLPRVVTEEK